MKVWERVSIDPGLQLGISGYELSTPKMCLLSDRLFAETVKARLSLSGSKLATP